MSQPSRMRLLYVDDDRINTLLFVETCRLGEGARELEVRSAGDGAEALALAGGWTPDALVIDLHLPDTDGHALLAALRALPGLAATPAFLCSAEDDAELRAAAAASGFSGCWPKPVDLASMLADLRRLRSGG